MMYHPLAVAVHAYNDSNDSIFTIDDGNIITRANNVMTKNNKCVPLHTIKLNISGKDGTTYFCFHPYINKVFLLNIHLSILKPQYVHIDKRTNIIDTSVHCT